MACILAQFYTDGPSTLAGVLVLPGREVIELLFRAEEDEAVGEFSLWRIINSDSLEYRRWQREIELALSIVEDKPSC